MKNVNSINGKVFTNSIRKHDSLVDSKQRLAKLEEENQQLKQKQDALEWNTDLMINILIDESVKNR